MLIFLACEPAAHPLVVPLGSSCCPVATQPQTGVSILTRWLRTDVSEPRPLFCTSGTFQQAEKKGKTGSRVVWTVLWVYLTCQGGERIWERAMQRLFVRLEHLGPTPGQQGGKRAGRRQYLLSLREDWIEKTNFNAKWFAFWDRAGIGWERRLTTRRKPLFWNFSSKQCNKLTNLLLMFFQRYNSKYNLQMKADDLYCQTPKSMKRH